MLWVLIEMPHRGISMSTHNICFCEVKKQEEKLSEYPSYLDFFYLICLCKAKRELLY